MGSEKDEKKSALELIEDSIKAVNKEIIEGLKEHNEDFYKYQETTIS